jgi:hypothetical protein
MYHIEEKEYYPRDKSGNMLEDLTTSFSNLEFRLPVLFAGIYIIFGIVIVITLFAQ